MNFGGFSVSVEMSWMYGTCLTVRSHDQGMPAVRSPMRIPANARTTPCRRNIGRVTMRPASDTAAAAMPR